MLKTFSALTVMAALGGPALLPASALAQDHRVSPDVRMYDRYHKDYHVWNGDEDRFYHQYLDEHHRKYREFSKMNKKQQREYWNWRHDHERR